MTRVSPVMALLAAWVTSVPLGAADGIVARSLTSGGAKRTYALYAPAGESPRPLVILLHGSGGSGRLMVQRWTDLARREGIVVAGPDAKVPSRWQPPEDGPILLHDLVEELRPQHVDPRRVYLFGHSAGAVFVLYMAPLESTYFAAAAIHAGAYGGEGDLGFLDSATRKIPLFVSAGASDDLYPPAAVLATARTLERAGFPVTTSFFSGGRHAYEPAGEINAQAWAFLKTHRLETDPVFVPVEFGVR
jgi:poly(3-hydroxybutyrate) depolymerase